MLQRPPSEKHAAACTLLGRGGGGGEYSIVYNNNIEGRRGNTRTNCSNPYYNGKRLLDTRFEVLLPRIYKYITHISKLDASSSKLPRLCSHSNLPSPVRCGREPKLRQKARRPDSISPCDPENEKMFWYSHGL